MRRKIQYFQRCIVPTVFVRRVIAQGLIVAAVVAQLVIFQKGVVSGVNILGPIVPWVDVREFDPGLIVKGNLAHDSTGLYVCMISVTFRSM